MSALTIGLIALAFVVGIALGQWMREPLITLLRAQRDTAWADLTIATDRAHVAELAGDSTRRDLDRIKSTRREAGFKAARTRKAREQGGTMSDATFAELKGSMDEARAHARGDLALKTTVVEAPDGR